MILKGNSRGGAKDLALHLMKLENDHVEVHELRGFVSRDLMGALNETYAISRATKCRAFMYSLSINPPPNEKVDTTKLIDAADKVEKSLGLEGQPRAVVFHEKEGRRHAHVVWSRIKVEDMKAIRMSFDHTKLQAVSRELFREHGFRMPDGLADKSKRDPRNFSLADWQQAKRSGQDAKAIKEAIQDAWAISDSKASLRHALEERGYVLARGDRRGFIVVDIFGEVRSLPRQIEVKTKDVRARLGDNDDLPSVEEANIHIADTMLKTFERLKEEQSKKKCQRAAEFTERKQILVTRQRSERTSLKQRQKTRWLEESLIRQSRFRGGLKGLWDTLRGHNRRIRQMNEDEAQTTRLRDRNEQDALIHKQLGERNHLKIFKLELRSEFERQREDIERDIRTYETMHGHRSRDGPSL